MNSILVILHVHVAVDQFDFGLLRVTGVVGLVRQRWRRRLHSRPDMFAILLAREVAQVTGVGEGVHFLRGVVDLREELAQVRGLSSMGVEILALLYYLILSGTDYSRQNVAQFFRATKIN